MAPNDLQTESGPLLHATAGLAIRARVPVLVVATLMALLSGAYAWDIPVQMSRHALVSAREPHQAALDRFVARFGRPDAILVVVEGGASEARRRVVDELCPALAKAPGLEGTPLCGLRLEDMLPIAVLHEPRALESMDRLAAGLAPFLDDVATKVDESLDDDDAAAAGAGDAAGLRRLLLLLDSQLRPTARPVPGAMVGDEALDVDEAGYLMAGEERHVIVVWPRADRAEGTEVVSVVEGVREIARAVATGPIRAMVTGVPAIAADELSLVDAGLAKSSLVAAALVLVTLLLALRSWVSVLVALVPLAVGTLVTLAIARLCFGGLNLITSCFVSLLLGLGVDFAVYIIAAHAAGGGRSGEGHPAIRRAVASTGPGIVVGALTTIAAFLLVMTTEFTAYAQLGAIVAVGLCVMMLASFVLVPALLAVTPHRADAPKPPAPRRGGWSWVMRWRTSIVCAAAAACAVAAFGWPRLSFNGRYFDFLPETTESARALAVLTGSPRLDPVFASLVVDDVEQARVTAARLRQLPTVRSVDAPSDLLPPLTDARLAALRAAVELPRAPAPERAPPLGSALGHLAEGLDEAAFAERQSSGLSPDLEEARQTLALLRARIGAEPDGGKALVASTEARVREAVVRARAVAEEVTASGRYAATALPPALRQRYAARDGSAFALHVRPRGNVWDPAVAKAFYDEVASGDRAVGVAVNAHVHTRMVVDGFTRATLLAGGLVLVILLLALRRVSDTLLAMLPVAVAMAMTLGAMGWLRLPLDLANVVLLPLLIGVGVDAGSHVMHQMQASASRRGGVAHLPDLDNGTTVALVAASATTMAGFAALLLGEHGAMRSLGASLTLGVGCSLLASAVLLPAVLVLLGRAGAGDAERP